MSLRHLHSLQEGLLKQVRDDSLTCLPDTPPWLTEMNDAYRADLGILALHSRFGLAEQTDSRDPSSTVRIRPSAVDHLPLLLTRQAIATKQHLAIAAPPGTIMMPMLIVCKALLGDLLESQEDPNCPDSIKARGGILLVSPDIEMRVRYFGMCVGQASVVDAYPACRMRPDGTVAPITARPTSGNFSVCFFLAQQKQLPAPETAAFKPAVVVLDLTHDRWVDRLPELVAWCLSLRDRHGAPAQMLALLPFGDRLTTAALREHHVSIFPLDSVAIRELAAGFSAPVEPQKPAEREAFHSWSYGPFVLDDPLERRHALWYIPDEASEDLLRTLRHIYRALDGVGAGRSHRDLRLAGWLAGTLMQLPIPVEWYEQHAYLMGNRQTLRKLINSIGARSDGGMNADLDPTLQTVRGHLQLLYERLSVANPKAESYLQHIKNQILPLLPDSGQIALLARNDVIARALSPWLLSEGIPINNHENLRVLSYKQITGRETFDRIVATGPWPSRYRWQIGGPLGRTIDFLLYAGEDVLLQKQMSTFYGSRARSFFAHTRAALLNSYSKITLPRQPSPSSERDDSFLPIALQTGRTSSEADAPFLDETSEGFEIDALEVASIFERVDLDNAAFTRVESDPESLDEPETIPTGSNPWSIARDDNEDDHLDLDVLGEAVPVGAITENCLRLTLQRTGEGIADSSEQYLYLPQDGSIECYIPGLGDEVLSRVANEEIVPGYVLIRTDRDDRESLFDRIVELADAQPTMKYLTVWRGYWLDAVDNLAQQHASGRARRGSYLRIQRQLADVGIKVTTQTIRGWILGERIGPGTVGAVKAIGHLTQHPMLLQHSEQVEKAFRQIRTIHQVLGMRISAALQRAGKVAQQPSSKATAKSSKQAVKLDPALTIPLDDLLDLLQYWEVIDAQFGPFTVPVTHVGIILRRAPFAIAPQTTTPQVEGA